MSRRFIIDIDTASDDAVALVMAHYWPDVQVDAITVVSGNVPLAQGSINARYTVEICGQATPVYEGADRPLRLNPGVGRSQTDAQRLSRAEIWYVQP